MPAKYTVKATVNSGAIAALKTTAKNRALLRRCAEAALNYQEATCPVDTGNMRSALGIRENSDGSMDIGTVKKKVPYVLPVEEGHRTRSGSWVPAQPFIRPSLDAAKKGLR